MKVGFVFLFGFFFLEGLLPCLEGFPEEEYLMQIIHKEMGRCPNFLPPTSFPHPFLQPHLGQSRHPTHTPVCCSALCTLPSALCPPPSARKILFILPPGEALPGESLYRYCECKHLPRTQCQLDDLGRPCPLGALFSWAVKWGKFELPCLLHRVVLGME